MRVVRTSSAVLSVALVATRAHRAIQHAPDTHTPARLFFDGVCNLCDGFVNFVADHDAQRIIQFAAQQKHQDELERLKAPTDLSTLVLVQGDHVYLYSSAAIRTFALLDWPYRALAVALVVPAPVRDLAYRLVAKYRYVVFGKTDSCRVPTGDFKRRFIDCQPDDDDPITAGGE